jgi:hypothetical protein
VETKKENARMLVYGDPSFSADARELALAMEQRAASTSADHLDDLRELLITAGQFEQALHDSATAGGIENRSWLEAADALTDAAAHAFYAALAQGESLLPSPTISARDALRDFHLLSQRLRAIPSQPVRVKVPEGFAFYALFPEQYAWAAVEWARRFATTQGAVSVIGIRSIGTSLSALVQTVLKSMGLEAWRCTVRPAGHPFHREVVLTDPRLQPRCAALIVDEGPGLSGSSILSTARALLAKGLSPARICILPGHNRPPGHAASFESKKLWASLPRCIYPLEKLQWHGRSLIDLLRRASLNSFAEESVECTEDWSAGLWRNFLFDSRDEWPAVSVAFEQVKYCYRSRSGRGVVWKFQGMAGTENLRRVESKRAFSRGEEIARLGWTCAPVGHCSGFVAWPLINGKPLDARAPLEVISKLTRYIGMVAGEPLSKVQLETSIDRLEALFLINVGELFGPAATCQAQALTERCRAVVNQGLPWALLSRAGDGHLAPWEWFRTAEGRLLKKDVTGHCNDHTAVGNQPVLWEIAGVLVEWELTESAEKHFLEKCHCGLEKETRAALAFYIAAYLAFRLGQIELAKSSASDAGHIPQSSRARQRYLRRLKSSLLAEQRDFKS